MKTFTFTCEISITLEHTSIPSWMTSDKREPIEILKEELKTSFEQLESFNECKLLSIQESK